jgi:hypothetical protein
MSQLPVTRTLLDKARNLYEKLVANKLNASEFVLELVKIGITSLTTYNNYLGYRARTNDLGGKSHPPKWYIEGYESDEDMRDTLRKLPKREESTKNAVAYT